MRRWIAPTLVSCAAAAAAAAQLFPAPASAAHAGRLAGLAVLLAAVAAVWIVWLRAGALLAAVERDRADCERRYSALFEACGDAACAYGLPDDGGPGLLCEKVECGPPPTGHE